jgi:hypothetical protein
MFRAPSHQQNMSAYKKLSTVIMADCIVKINLVYSVYLLKLEKGYVPKMHAIPAFATNEIKACQIKGPHKPCQITYAPILTATITNQRCS